VAFVPHWVRPVLIAGLVLLWASLELGFRSLLGDPSWLNLPSPVHLGPQARQAVLTLEFHQRELAGAGPTKWTVPVWRFFEVRVRPWNRPADRLDLARILAPGCLLLPTDEPVPRLKSSAREMARRVWIARHWDEERIVALWASRVARARDVR